MRLAHLGASHFVQVEMLSKYKLPQHLLGYICYIADAVEQLDMTIRPKDHSWALKYKF